MDPNFYIFFYELILVENGRKWLGKWSKCSKLIVKSSHNVPKCTEMSQNVHFRRIVVRTDLFLQYLGDIHIGIVSPYWSSYSPCTREYPMLFVNLEMNSTFLSQGLCAFGCSLVNKSVKTSWIWLCYSEKLYIGKMFRICWTKREHGKDQV